MSQLTECQGPSGSNLADQVPWDELIETCEHHVPIEHACEECTEEQP